MSAQNIIIALFGSWTAFLCILLVTSPLKYVKLSRWFSQELFMRVVEGKSTYKQIIPALIVRNTLGTIVTLVCMYHALFLTIGCIFACMVVTSVVARLKLGKGWMWKLAFDASA